MATLLGTLRSGYAPVYSERISHCAESKAYANAFPRVEESALSEGL